MGNFDDYAVQIDAECLTQDFDDVDLYGTKMVGDDNETETDIQFE